ncbi:germin-like protein 8-5 [Cinnamomum micranthum f. kanehirae]|uniref:Germin-like protein n=1 Tax=Cinnamomum micranthum f. kanehirae TaxID=337451 RepID=A0A3S3MKV1_9MAGN|nr:germin-like protein 8-5 [Cinnamomum micranthum f. kanehirae]
MSTPVSVFALILNFFNLDIDGARRDALRGLVLSNQNNNTLISKILIKGDVFVFPKRFIHFQANIGHIPAVAIASLNSQNPGVITIANVVFGLNPPIFDYALAKAFQVDKKVIDYLQAQLWVAS